MNTSKPLIPKFILIFMLLIMPVVSNGQSKAALEKEKAQLEQEIKKLNNELAKVKKNTKLSTTQLNALNKQINERTRLIRNINNQMSLLDKQITVAQDSIVLMNHRIDSMKAEYAKAVRIQYRNRDNLEAYVLLFDTPSYNRSFLKYKYFSAYSRYRRLQSQQIKEQEQTLQTISQDLQRQKEEKNSLLLQEQQHKKQLDKEKQQKQKSVNESKSKEKNLTAQLSKKEKQKKQLQQQIQKMINEEISKSKKSGGAVSGSSPSKPSTEEAAMSSKFEENKGRLSWPVYYKSVLREYGRYRHESGGENMNNGIDLITAPGATVYCIFNGVVSRIFTCPNGTKGIIIRHGEYMTVYANMGTVSVKEGAKVNTKQSIGTVYTADNGSAEFSFQLWKGTQSQNPRNWLR
mgnify:CR=1 FL=1